MFFLTLIGIDPAQGQMVRTPHNTMKTQYVLQ